MQLDGSGNRLAAVRPELDRILDRQHLDLDGKAIGHLVRVSHERYRLDLD